jgi:tetratricopeptide (TPR) repeat protein
MRLVSNDYGDEFPIGGAQIEIEIEGRVLILLTDSKGRFSVPISTNYPIGSYLFILSPDPSSNKIKEIKVPVSNSYLKRSKIIYSKKTNDYKIIPNGIIENTQRLFAETNFISTAYADNENPELKEGIDKEILSALEIITKISFEEIPRNVLLKDDLNLDNIDLSYINNRLNKKYNIDSLAAFQYQAETVGDLIEIARFNYYKNTAQQSKKLIKPFSTITKISPAKAMDHSMMTKMVIPKDILVKYKLGRILKKNERYQFAVKILKQVIEEKPSFYQAWLHLALTYDSMEENEAAEAAFKSAIELDESKKLNDDRLYNAYGMFLFKQQRYEEAGIQFEKEKQFKLQKQRLD